MQSSGLTPAYLRVLEAIPLPPARRAAIRAGQPHGPLQAIAGGDSNLASNPCPGPHAFQTHSYICLLHTDPQRQGADTIC